MQGRNLPHRDLWVLRVGGGTCVTGLKLSRQLHMVASGWHWLPVVSYLVHEHYSCKANLRWTGVYNKDVVQMRSSFNVHILEMYIIYVTYNVYIYIYLFMYSLYFITLQRSGTRPVTKPLRSIRPEHRGTFHTQFWPGTKYLWVYRKLDKII